MTTAPHAFPHGSCGMPNGAPDAISERRRELPLLGSNQDSPDPESGATARSTRRPLTEHGREQTQTDTERAESHTEAHTARHCPRCERDLPLSAFGVRRERGRERPQSYCRECASGFTSTWAKGGGKTKHRASVSAYRARYPERRRARERLAAAVARGAIVRGECVIGGDCAGPIDGHHDDYSRPFDVRWVCRRHHPRLDRERRRSA